MLARRETSHWQPDHHFRSVHVCRYCRSPDFGDFGVSEGADVAGGEGCGGVAASFFAGFSFLGTFSGAAAPAASSDEKFAKAGMESCSPMQP